MCKNLKTTFGVLASVCSVCPHLWCVGFSQLCLSPTLMCWLQSALSVPSFGVLASVCSVCPQLWCVGFSLLCLSPALVCWLQSALSVPSFGVLASACSVCPQLWCVGFGLLCLSPALVCWLRPALSVPSFGVLASACSVCPQLTAGCRRAGNPQAPEERVWRGYEGVCAGGPGVLWGSDGGAQLPDQPGAPEHRLPHAEQPPGHGGGGAGRRSIPGGSAHRSVSPCHTHTCHRTFLEQSSSGTSKIPMYRVPM